MIDLDALPEVVRAGYEYGKAELRQYEAANRRSGDPDEGFATAKKAAHDARERFRAAIARAEP